MVKPTENAMSAAERAGPLPEVTGTPAQRRPTADTEELADASRREDREVLERSEVTADASRREDREVLERSEVTG